MKPRSLNARGRWINPAVAAGLMVLILVWVGDDYYRQSLWMLGSTYAILALAMYIPIVLAQKVSLAYAAYAAIGGYTVAILASNGQSPWWAWLLAPVVAALAAIVLGWATRRLNGFYLVAVTLLFANAFSSWARTSEFTGAAFGIAGLPRAQIGDWVLGQWDLVVGAAVLVWIIAFLLDRLRVSRWGVVARSMGEVPHAVEAAGVRVRSLELVALGLGAAIAALAGSLFVTSVRNVNPETFSLELVFLVLFIPVIGGMVSPWGAVLGAAIVAHLTLNIPWLPEGGTLVVAVGALAILLIAPQGILGLLQSAFSWAREQIARRVRKDEPSV